MHVAKIDQWAWVVELALHQEIAHAFWFVESGFFNDSLNFLEVAETSTGLNILEVDIWIISVWQYIAKEHKQAFICAVRLQNLN